MQKIAAQVGDKKLIKLRLYRQTDSEYYKVERGRGAGGELASRPMAQCQSSAECHEWAEVCAVGVASRVRAVKII